MGRFLAISLAFMLIIAFGLAYADDSSLYGISASTHNMNYNKAGEIAAKEAIDFEAGEQEEENSWIEVELNNEEIESISSEVYEVDLLDGDIREEEFDANE